MEKLKTAQEYNNESNNQNVFFNTSINDNSQKKRNLIISAILGISVLLLIAFIYAYSQIYKATQQYVINSTEDKISLITENTNSFLQKAKNTVDSNAGSIEYMISNGESNGDILEYLLFQTDYEIGRIDGSFTGMYGYYRGEYLDGNRWDPYADGGVYYPKERPWYLAAKDSNGEVGVASPYLDMDTGNVVLSVTKMLSDNESVVGLDISLASLTDYINHYLASSEFSYAYIIDNTGTIVASKDASDTGLNFFNQDADKDTMGLKELFEQALQSDEPFEYIVDEHEHLVISNTIENDWQVIALADKEIVNAQLRRLALMCVSLLLILFVVLLLFAINSIRDNKLNILAKQKEERYLKELKDNTDQLSSYKKAVLSDALISLEINLSKDEIYYGVWKDDEGKEKALYDILGLNVPCSYNEYIRLWNVRFVIDNSSKPFARNTDTKHLLNEFDRGKTEITFDYEAKTISGKTAWLRRNIYMTTNQDGDVIAYTSVKDVTTMIGQNKREEAYIRALAVEYDSIAVVNFNEKKYRDKIALHSHLDKDFASLVSEEFIKESRFSKRLNILATFIHPDDRQSFIDNTLREKIIESFNNNKTHAVDFRLMKSNGESLYYQERFIALKDEDGKIIGMIACLRNIDDEIRKELGIRKELEDAIIAAEAANKAKSSFLFNMSHDIRTPMNAIIGFTDIASKYIDDKKRVEESLEKVRMSSDHLLSLINDVLDMSRVESGNVVIQEEPNNIKATLDNLYSIMAGNGKAKELTLSLNVDSSLVHQWVYVDRLHLMRILTNIVSNSIKYTNPGGKIDISLEELPCEKQDYAHYRYTISDTGIGMSKEFLEHIYEPFLRAESATKSGITGTGLGMSITKSLVELMDGTISIDSEVGKGTTVVIDLENKISDPVQVNNDINDTQYEVLAGKKVLLVEDNELNREIALDILEEEGIIVDTANDGDIAVDKVKNNEYSIVLMDIQMPKMNGYEATREIRKFNKDIPIVAMTANAFDEDKQSAAEAGMNGHITKPIDVTKLKDTIASFFK